MSNTTKTKHVVIDPKTGRHMRDATPLEIVEYTAANRPAPFDRPAWSSTGTLVDTYNGPGLWVGGAGF